MPGKPMLTKLYDYSDEMNTRFLDLAAALSQEAFTESPGYSRGSLRDLLTHILYTERIWRSAAQDPQQPFFQRPPEAGHTVDELRLFMLEEKQARQQFFDSLSEDDLAAEMQVADPRGRTHTFTRWAMLMHPFIHSVQHRSEAATILTRQGQSPGDVDFIFYILNHP